MRAVDSRIDQVNRNALVVDQITLRGAAAGIITLPNAIGIVIGERLAALRIFSAAPSSLGAARADLREISLDLVGNVPAVTNQIISRVQSGDRRRFADMKQAKLAASIGSYGFIEWLQRERRPARRSCFGTGAKLVAGT